MIDPERLDTANLQRIEELRARFDRLRTERIRADTEVERLKRELELARQEARAMFGTDSEEEIHRMIEATRLQNTRLVEEFGALLHDIESRLLKLGESR